MPIWPFQVSGPAQGEVPPFVPQPSSTRQVSSTGLSRRCCLRASPDRPTRLRLAVPKWTRRQGEETPLGPSSGEETPISQDGMSYRVRSLPSSLFHPSNRALPSDCVARVEKLTQSGVPLLGAVGKSQHPLPSCNKRRTHSVGLCGHVACVLHA